MSIPGLGTLKTWGLILLSLGMSIALFLFKSEQVKRTKEKLKGEIQARKTSDATNQAMMDGMDNEQNEINKAANPNNSDRDGFE